MAKTKTTFTAGKSTVYKPSKKKAPAVVSKGFGFVPSQSEHHFTVTMPKAKDDKNIYISEHLHWDESTARQELSTALGHEENKMRVVLLKSKWDAIADAVRVEFNSRLKRNAMPSGKWLATQTHVSRLLGKELVLLAWAIEDADPGSIPTAIRNWQGLAPEERWWLFTMTNAATGHAITGKNKGWRKAVRFALTENPVTGTSASPRESLFSLVRDEVESI
ncbi:MAG: DUF3780 domain-containing protein [Verrucomicrobiae bacterium]|nr:DUF3780 domain-containing protein [Verrucomicrobiae bacterium]